MSNPNPNEPNFPYSGGTDNPGDDTSHPGGGVMVETGAPQTAVLYPAIPSVLAQAFSDTQLGALQAVPPTGAGFGSAVDRGPDPEGGTDPLTGSPREAGQDETAGASETTSGVAPVAFPEPNP